MQFIDLNFINLFCLICIKNLINIVTITVNLALIDKTISTL